MGRVGVGDAIWYGVELLVYHLVIYLIGGLLAAIGFALLMSGISTRGVNDPGVLLGAGLFFIVAWVVIVAGELGIIYKVIADAVKEGMEGPAPGERSGRRSSSESGPSP